MLQGVGNTFIQTVDLAGGLTAQNMLEVFLYEFEFTSEAEALEAQAYTAGVRKTKSTGEASVSDTLTMRFQYQDWAQLGLVLDQKPQVDSSVKIPVLKYATVPSSTPYEIADAAISVANDNYVFAYINNRGSWGQPGALQRATTPATPGEREVGVDTTGNKLVFNADQAGASISYTVPDTYTSIEYYGGSGTPTNYGKLSMYGKIYSPESPNGFYVYFPELTRQSRPSFSFTGDVPTLEIIYGAATPAGWAQPFKWWNLDTGVV